MELDALINAMVTGLFVGVGSTLGAWLATRTIVKNFEKLEELLKKNGNGKS